MVLPVRPYVCDQGVHAAPLFRMQLHSGECRLTRLLRLGRTHSQLRLELQAPDQKLSLPLIGDVDAICGGEYLQGVSCLVMRGTSDSDISKANTREKNHS